MTPLRPIYLIALVLLSLAFVVACGDDEENIGTANVIHQFTEDVEANSFDAVVAPWEELTEGDVEVQATRDITAIVTTRVRAGNPPDFAVLSQPGLVAKLAKDGELVALDSFLDMDRVRNEYSQATIDLCTIEGKFYCLVYKASHKAIVWYNPKEFTANGWNVPTTWDEMIALSDQIVATGRNPWSMGVESAAASGWPGTDWIGSILLAESGPAVYDQWVNHEIAWSDSAIRSAWEKFGKIAHTNDYIPGGADFALSSGFVAASYLLYESPPKAHLYHLAGFIGSEIPKQFPAAVVGEDFDFFLFPPVKPEFAGAITGGGDLVVMFNDNETNRSLMKYLSTSAAQQIWVSRGGFISTNTAISLDNYDNPIDKKIAGQLGTAKIFRFDADDIWGGDLQATFWNGVLEFLSDPDDLDGILNDIEAAAVNQLGPLP